MRRSLAAVLAVILVTGLLVGAVAPTAAQPTGGEDECKNADEGPEENGPPGFVGSLVPNFLSDLFASLPVPNFAKAFFGAPTC